MKSPNLMERREKESALKKLRFHGCKFYTPTFVVGSQLLP